MHMVTEFGKIPSGRRFWSKIFMKQSIDSHTSNILSSYEPDFFGRPLRIPEIQRIPTSLRGFHSPPCGRHDFYLRCTQRSTRHQVTCGQRCYCDRWHLFRDEKKQTWWRSHGICEHSRVFFLSLHNRSVFLGVPRATTRRWSEMCDFCGAPCGSSCWWCPFLVGSGAHGGPMGDMVTWSSPFSWISPKIRDPSFGGHTLQFQAM